MTHTGGKHRLTDLCRPGRLWINVVRGSPPMMIPMLVAVLVVVVSLGMI